MPNRHSHQRKSPFLHNFSLFLQLQKDDLAEDLFALADHHPVADGEFHRRVAHLFAVDRDAALLDEPSRFAVGGGDASLDEEG